MRVRHRVAENGAPRRRTRGRRERGRLCRQGLVEPAAFGLGRPVHQDVGSSFHVGWTRIEHACRPHGGNHFPGGQGRRTIRCIQREGSDDATVGFAQRLGRGGRASSTRSQGLRNPWLGLQVRLDPRLPLADGEQAIVLCQAQVHGAPARLVGDALPRPRRPTHAHPLQL